MPPRLSEAEIEKLRLLYEESPLPVTAIALQAGHDASAIYSYARRRGWKPRAARRRPRLPRAEIRALYEQTIVPVNEIARLAGVAEHTVYVYAAREGWQPRASRLRDRGRAGREIADLAAEVAQARRRAEEEQKWRELRSLTVTTEIWTKLLARENRTRLRARKQAEREKAGARRRVWLSPEEKTEIGLDARRRDVAKVLEGLRGAATPASSRPDDESE